MIVYFAQMNSKRCIYLNDAYKRAIIKSQEQKEISLDVKNSLNAWYDIQPLKMQKTKQLLEVGELGKHCKAELVPFVGLQHMVRVRGWGWEWGLGLGLGVGVGVGGEGWGWVWVGLGLGFGVWGL